MTSQDLAGTEHPKRKFISTSFYMGKAEVIGENDFDSRLRNEDEYRKVLGNVAQAYAEDVAALCDHIDWQQCHIEALDVALRESGERRAAVEQEVEDLQEKNEQAWERAALEARRVLKNGSKARKLEKKVEDLEDYINRAIKQLYDGLDMFDHDMRFHAENAIEILGKAATKEKP